MKLVCARCGVEDVPRARPGALGLWPWEPSPGALLVCGELLDKFGRGVLVPPASALCLVVDCDAPRASRGRCGPHYSKAAAWIRADRKRRSWSSPELTAQLAGGTTQ